MDSTVWHLAVAAVAGAAAGAFYFGGLWFTMRWMTEVRRPGLFALMSFAVRVAPTLAVFYLVMDGRPERLIACLGGFIGARTLILFWQQPGTAPLEERS